MNPNPRRDRETVRAVFGSIALACGLLFVTLGGLCTYPAVTEFFQGHGAKPPGHPIVTADDVLMFSLPTLLVGALLLWFAAGRLGLRKGRRGDRGAGSDASTRPVESAGAPRARPERILGELLLAGGVITIMVGGGTCLMILGGLTQRGQDLLFEWAGLAGAGLVACGFGLWLTDARRSRKRGRDPR